MNMQQMMKQAQKMQRQLAAAQDELAELELTATAGGGMVKVTGTADGQVSDIQIDGEALGLPVFLPPFRKIHKIRLLFYITLC